MTTIEQVIDADPRLGWSDRLGERIAAGLTNANYRVTVDGVAVLRPDPGTLDRAAVRRSRQRGGEHRRGRRRGGRPGGPPSPARVGRPRPRLAAGPDDVERGLRRGRDALAGRGGRSADSTPGPASATTSTCSARPRRICGSSDERSIPIPAGYREALPEIRAIEPALAARPLPTVPCHNDLLADNYLDDGDRLWIVDYEYSGNDDPAFELGNTCQELGWAGDRMAHLAEAYFGRASPPLLARMRLQAIMSDVGWTLWAAIQAVISEIDYDFTGWAEERWARASASLADPDLGRWLADVRRDADAD